MKKHVISTLSLFFLLSNLHTPLVYTKISQKADAQVSQKKSNGGLFKNFSLPSFVKSPFGNNKTETVSYHKDISPTAGITISNTTGDVTVKAWKNPSIVIDAVKKGTILSVDNTQIAIHKDKNSDVSITTVTSEGQKPCTVHYTLLVPEGCKLESVATEKGKIKIHNLQNKIVARTKNGAIEMNNVAGTIETSTSKGQIIINTNTIIPDTRIFAYSKHGKINVSVPKKTNAVLTAEAKRGRIESTVDITTKPQTMKYTAKTLAQLKQKADGIIGKGGSASINLRTESGNITLHEV